MNDNAGSGHVAAIYLTENEGGELQSLDSVRALQGAGLESDRYQKRRGTFSKEKMEAGQQITLIESEAVQRVIAGGVDIGSGKHRRNIETTGVSLNELVGETFQVGEVTVRGIRLCHPCAYLSKIVGEDMITLLKNAGGLRGEIVDDGMIRVGDSIAI